MDLLVERKQRVLQVTLNRPGKRNALTFEMCSGIVKAVESAEHDSHVGAVLICSAGPVFSAGMDVDEALTMDGPELASVHDDLFSLGARCLKPMVICVCGAALGGGLGLVAQGHIVMAAQGAVFGLPEIRLGLWPFLVYRAVESAIGPRRTLELSLTARTFDAEEALDWGLVYQVCPQLETIERTHALAREIAKASPHAIHAGMQYARDSRGKSWSEAGTIATKLRAQLMEHADFREGCAAFKERREPHWPSMPASFYEQKENHKRR